MYHVASGQAFFSGVALMTLAVGLSAGRNRRWCSLGRTLGAVAGMALVVASSTPLPFALAATAWGLTAVWLVAEGVGRPSLAGPRNVLRWAVVAAWWLGVAPEVPYHRTPALAAMGDPPLVVVGDSLSAGMGHSFATWPKILARRHRVTVEDRALAGATAGTAIGQADAIASRGALVLVEIGGNDVLGGTPPVVFACELDALLARLVGRSRAVVMLELPLPPLSTAYGAIQRRLAREHGVPLVPKRLLMGALAAKGATLDTIHLSPAGHERMAAAVWSVVRPAYSNPQVCSHE